MTEKATTIQRIAILAHPQIPEAVLEAANLAAFLREYGLHVSHGLLNDRRIRRQVETKKCDVVIALGGDGTMLRAGHLCGPNDVPILGINMGRFGFLMEIQENQWRETLPRLLSGDYWIENRMMLHAQRSRAGEMLGSWDVVNEAVVSRGSYVRPVLLETRVEKAPGA